MAIIVWAFVFVGLALEVAKSTLIFLDYIGRSKAKCPPISARDRTQSISAIQRSPQSACDFWFSYFPMASKTATFFGLISTVIPLTLILSEVLYRCVELPGIAAGNALAASLGNYQHRSIGSSR